MAYRSWNSYAHEKLRVLLSGRRKHIWLEESNVNFKNMSTNNMKRGASNRSSVWVKILEDNLDPSRLIIYYEAAKGRHTWAASVQLNQ